ncbi:MAG: hypothetical protein Hyperionvirus34_4 [Hyperionvirus sp.]|uniref:Uncharacterized protein n=1 Tax=Hyperionvirus sp. TaxID=2487770 RepID=A0A3G5ABW4_9VIRU|nr:MAG: hypothetical protein Hyperionvirus34_4 [Hyperionvirus sp.]
MGNKNTIEAEKAALNKLKDSLLPIVKTSESGGRMKVIVYEKFIDYDSFTKYLKELLIWNLELDEKKYKSTQRIIREICYSEKNIKFATEWYLEHLSDPDRHFRIVHNLVSLKCRLWGSAPDKSRILTEELLDWIIKALKLESPGVKELYYLYYVYQRGLEYFHDILESKWITEDKNSFEVMQLADIYRLLLNREKYVFWLEKAGELNNIEAIDRLGYLYGDERAFYWCNKGVSLKSAESCFRLGSLYTCDKNFVPARENYMLAYDLFSDDSKKDACMAALKSIYGQMDPLVITESLRDREKLLEEIDRLKTELSYQPGGSGAKLAGEHFESLAGVRV